MGWLVEALAIFFDTKLGRQSWVCEQTATQPCEERWKGWVLTVNHDWASLITISCGRIASSDIVQTTKEDAQEGNKFDTVRALQGATHYFSITTFLHRKTYWTSVKAGCLLAVNTKVSMPGKSSIDPTPSVFTRKELIQLINPRFTVQKQSTLDANATSLNINDN